MRNALTYGALGGGALLAGGQAIREQEDPGSIFLAGLGGGAGAIGGGLGAPKLLVYDAELTTPETTIVVFSLNPESMGALASCALEGFQELPGSNPVVNGFILNCPTFNDGTYTINYAFIQTKQ